LFYKIIIHDYFIKKILKKFKQAYRETPRGHVTFN